MKVKMNTRKPSQIAPARAPSRLRGELRVAALLEAAATAFAEKGYEATTMTEVAARAGAAIGSLYQFFPSKESLAQALLGRYKERLIEGVRAVADRADSLSPREVAEALIALRLDLLKARSPALQLAEVRTAAGERASVRVAMRGEVARAIRSLHSQLGEARTAAMAVVVMQLLKAVPPLAEEDPEGRLGLLRELGVALASYLGTGADGSHTSKVSSRPTGRRKAKAP